MIRRFPDLESAYEELTVIEQTAAPGLAVEIRDRARWSPQRKVLWANANIPGGDGGTPKYQPDVIDVEALTTDEAIATDLTTNWRQTVGNWCRATKRTPENKRAVWKHVSRRMAK